MDTTEQRSGFRLPWTERREQDWRADGTPGQTASTGEDGTEDLQMAETVDPADAGRPDTGRPDEVGTDAAPATDPGATPTEGPRRPSRFLADLTRAMHAAAAEERQSALDQFRADGKRTVEGIQSRSTDDAAALRRQADEDVARIREWSKAEIARIREETDRRIAERKAHLDHQLEGHAAIVDREIEHVQEQVAAYDGEMATFFDTLLAEEDPGRFAALAASLPEPPVFRPVSEAERLEIEACAFAGPPAVEEAVAEVGADAAITVQAAPDESVAAETTADVMLVVEAAAEDGDATLPEAETGSIDVDTGLTARHDLADAERAALAGVGPDETSAVSPHGASLSARLAGLVTPARPETASKAVSDEGPATTTQVVVTGLTSVASIAAFKRQLSRLDAVRSVAVSSGPSEEFVFAVVHGEGHPLADGIASLTGFAPHVERADAAEIVVRARDPES